MTYLSASRDESPKVISSPPDEKDENAPGTLGFVVPSFDHGSIILKDDSGKVIRLAWEEPIGSESHEDATTHRDDSPRALTPGHYVIVGYRLVKESTSGERWFLSSSAPQMGEIQIVADEVTEIEIPDNVYFSCFTRKTDRGMIAACSLQGLAKSGVTLYREGVRIPIDYTIEDEAGESLASGTMEYG